MNKDVIIWFSQQQVAVLLNFSVTGVMRKKKLKETFNSMVE